MARLLFVQNLWHEFPGLMSIAAVIKTQGHECDLHISRDAASVLEAIRDYRPDLVGFSVMMGTVKWSREISRRIAREGGPRVIWGGFYPTIYPEEAIALEGVDLLCIGEGEYPTLELLTAMDRGDDPAAIPNLWVKRRGKVVRNRLRPLVRLDALPFSDRHLYGKYPFFDLIPTVVAIDRYCMNSCTFCCQPMLRRVYRDGGVPYHSPEFKYYQKIKVERVVEELKQIKSSVKYRNKQNKLIYFGSDNTNGDPEWFMRFFKAYKESISLPFFCSLCLKDFNEEQARLLKEANNYIVGCGIESGNERLRNNVLGKNLSTGQIRKAARLIKKYDLFLLSGNMVGIPGETVDDALESIRLHREIGSRGVVVFLCQPYRDSALERYAINHGYLKRKIDNEAQTTFHDASPLSQPEIRDLENLHKLFLLAIKLPDIDWLLKRLVKLPPNPFFDLIFLSTHGYLYMKKLQNLGFLGSMKFTLHHMENSCDFLFRRASRAPRGGSPLRPARLMESLKGLLKARRNQS